MCLKLSVKTGVSVLPSLLCCPAQMVLGIVDLSSVDTKAVVVVLHYKIGAVFRSFAKAVCA